MTPRSSSRVVEDPGGVDVQGVDGDAGVPEVLSDHLTLLRNAEVPVHGAPGLRHDRLFGGGGGGEGGREGGMAGVYAYERE